MAGGDSGESVVTAVAVELEGTVGRVAFVISDYWGEVSGVSEWNEAAYTYSRIWGALIRDPVGWGSYSLLHRDCT